MDARTVVRADALFEAALGLALVVGAASGENRVEDFPHPVGTATHCSRQFASPDPRRRCPLERHTVPLTARSRRQMR